VRDADVIVVLDGGTIIETGTHEVLMAHPGRYADLFTLQAAGYRDTAGSR
jgi:ATP-binding cassette subfamily B protein